MLSCTGTLATTLGLDQPFRYRGYVYDTETGWYYLQSRYYSPETCRFISADVLLSTGQGVLGHNSFAYCLGNPALYEDGFGSRPCITEVLDGRSGTVEEDEYYSEDNIYRFNTDDLRFSEEANYYRIGKSDANRFYHQISAGDFGTIISPPLFSWLFEFIKYGDAISVIADLWSQANSNGFADTYDSQGRLLYLEEGYTVSTIVRGYNGSCYCATETEYFIYDEYMRLIYHDTVMDTYITD